MDLKRTFHNMHARLRRTWRKLTTTTWWVCEWRCDESVGAISRQSGEFAALGCTREEAEVDAIKALHQKVIGTVTVSYRLRKPSLIERLEGS